MLLGEYTQFFNQFWETAKFLGNYKNICLAHMGDMLILLLAKYE